MPNIKSISDLSNDTIVSVDELAQLKATIQLLTKLEEGEQSAREKGWLTMNEVETALEL